MCKIYETAVCNDAFHSNIFLRIDCSSGQSWPSEGGYVLKRKRNENLERIVTEYDLVTILRFSYIWYFLTLRDCLEHQHYHRDRPLDRRDDQNEKDPYK